MCNSKKYKILFIINGTNFGGAELILYNIVKNIDRSIFSPEIISLKKIDCIGEKIVQEGVPIINLHYTGIFNLLFFWKLYRYIKCQKPDIINTIMFHSDIIGRIIGKLTGIKVITSFHSIYLGNNKFSTKIREIITKISDPLSSAATIVSQNAAEYFLKHKITAKNKLTVILNGIDCEFYQNRFDDEKIKKFKKKYIYASNEFIFISAGRLIEYKGFEYLIKAAEILKRKNFIFKIIIAGDGRLFNKLKNLTLSLNLENNLQFIGKVDNLNEWLWISDAFVQTSLFEGFSCVLLEAMAAGLPVITTNVGGNPEIVINNYNGYLIEPNNENILADKMIGLMKLDKDSKLNLGKNGSARVFNNFQIPQMVKNYETLYRKIIEE